MTDTRFQPVDAPERETAKEPPKRWRNWFWFEKPLPAMADGFSGVAGPGAVEAPRTFPSKDTARTRAFEHMSHWTPEWLDSVEYLGAFPEGEQPKRQN